jgi:hypothetical protein
MFSTKFSEVIIVPKITEKSEIILLNNHEALVKIRGGNGKSKPVLNLWNTLKTISKRFR